MNSHASRVEKFAFLFFLFRMSSLLLVLFIQICSLTVIHGHTSSEDTFGGSYLVSMTPYFQLGWDVDYKTSIITLNIEVDDLYDNILIGFGNFSQASDAIFISKLVASDYHFRNSKPVLDKTQDILKQKVFESGNRKLIQLSRLLNTQDVRLQIFRNFLIPTRCMML